MFHEGKLFFCFCLLRPLSPIAIFCRLCFLYFIFLLSSVTNLQSFKSHPPIQEFQQIFIDHLLCSRNCVKFRVGLEARLAPVLRELMI